MATRCRHCARLTLDGTAYCDSLCRTEHTPPRRRSSLTERLARLARLL